MTLPSALCKTPDEDKEVAQPEEGNAGGEGEGETSDEINNPADETIDPESPDDTEISDASDEGIPESEVFAQDKALTGYTLEIGIPDEV